MTRIPIEDDQQQPEADRRGFKSKEAIALMSLAFTMLLQIMLSVWWAATLSADVRHLTQRFDTMDDKQYTRSDAKRDLARVHDRLEEYARRITALEAELREKMNHPNGRGNR